MSLIDADHVSGGIKGDKYVRDGILPYTGAHYYPKQLPDGKMCMEMSFAPGFGMKTDIECLDCGFHPFFYDVEKMMCSRCFGELKKIE